MKVRRGLLVGSLAVALVASIGIGWAIARGNDGSPSGDIAVLGDGSELIQPPTLETNAIAEGTPFPSAVVQTLQGDDVDTASLVGQPMVVNVWASTCAPCKKELPAFAAAQAKYGDQVRFVGISYLPPSDREESFARDRGIQYELLYDGNGDFLAEAGVAAFPVTYFVTADGTIVRQTGQLTEDELVGYIESDLL